jgi:hypothetical protein
MTLDQYKQMIATNASVIYAAAISRGVVDPCSILRASTLDAKEIARIAGIEKPKA